MPHDDPALAIVSGGQQGIGEAIARALFRAGHDVLIADTAALNTSDDFIERWQCDESLSPVEKRESGVYCVTTDVSDEHSVNGLFATIRDNFDQPARLLVNNAAVQTWSPFLELDVSDWKRTLDVNLTGMFVMTQAFARQAQACDSACVINIGSGCNALAFPKLVSYAASKGGVEMLTRVSALELGPMGIRVNCIAPGAIETARTQQETSGYAERWEPLTPLGRIGQVEDVADAVLAMADEKMRFVTGQTVYVDGGLFSQAIWPSDY